MTRTLPIAFLLIFFPALSWAATYQWVDENGVTVYSQLPPPNQQEARKVAPPPPPATSPKDAQQELRNLQQRLADSREDRELQADKAKKESENQQLRAENCRKAKDNLRILQQRARQMIKQSDGSYRRYTPQEKAEKTAEYEAMIKKSCN